jgi:uncharacterized protein (TIGR02588 family)
MNDVASDRERQTSRSFAEWISFSISLLVLTFVVGLVVYQSVTKKDRPPILSVTTDPNIRQIEGQFYVPFTVTNKGGEAVESVEIKAELDVNGETEEIGSQQIDFLSEGETQSGAFIFNQNPSQGKPIVRVTGYKLP